MKIFNKFKKGNGFSIIELMVSFAVLTIGISAVINLIGQGLKSSIYSKNQTIASYLAVEGIELLKNKRDVNFLDNKPWLQNLDDCKTANGCMIDPLNFGITPCAANCDPLIYDTSTDLYNYSNGLKTIFTRKILVKGTSDEREISSEVFWTDRFGFHTYVLKNQIYNWKP